LLLPYKSPTQILLSYNLHSRNTTHCSLRALKPVSTVRPSRLTPSTPQTPAQHLHFLFSLPVSFWDRRLDSQHTSRFFLREVGIVGVGRRRPSNLACTS
ncbi:hypothetical protein CH063_13933, partial [Colletotrichum higginsianum]